MIKNLSAVQETRVGKIPRTRQWQPILLFLSGEGHGQKNLTDDSSWGLEESDMTEQLMHNPLPESLSRRISCFLLGVPTVLYHKQGTSHVALL